MEFTSKEDIEAPISGVFAFLSEFESFERSAIRRGVEVRRIGDLTSPLDGLAWEADFVVRGKSRHMRVNLIRFDPDTNIRFEGKGSGVLAYFDIELIALSPRRTRMSVHMSLQAQTLSARLFLQSMKLAKKNLGKRFKLKVADYAKIMEDRLGRMA